MKEETTEPQIMLDLETMGNGPEAAIIAIGAVEFDLLKGILGREFYQVVDLESSMKAGGVVDASTILWWMQQSDEARKEFSQKGNYLSSTLLDFRTWIKDFTSVSVWGNGAAFDNVILRSAYNRLSIIPPWNFRHDRCFRTVRWMYPVIDTSGWETVEHNALEDAKWQAKYLIEIWKQRR